MLSKPLLINTVIRDDTENVIKTLNYTDYFANEINLNKMKLPELKKIAKSHRLLVSGKKAIVIDRIVERFTQDKNATLIQNLCKKHIVGVFIRSLDNTESQKLCINDTDFYTLEPLDEIDGEVFLVYKDEDDFEYGFNVISLLLLIKNSKKIARYVLDLKLLNVLLKNIDIVEIHNPYNRRKFPSSVVERIIRKALLINIFFPHHLKDILVYGGSANESSGNVLRDYNYMSNADARLNIIRNNYRTAMTLLQERPLEERIESIFMEIDQLGNYTQSSWFSNLNREDYIRLYRNLYEIWFYRGQISQELRRQICVLTDPFREIQQRRLNLREISGEFIKDACLRVFEYMVLTGIDVEHRKIGALHALSALTVVSREARVAMPYLYESL